MFYAFPDNRKHIKVAMQFIDFILTIFVGFVKKAVIICCGCE